MSNSMVKITALPTRFEPLTNTFGDRAKTTFVASHMDLEVAKRFLSSAESSRQGKIMFLAGESGAGKSTFVHSLEIFVSEKVTSIIRLPQPHELDIADIPKFVSQVPVRERMTVINFDGREAPYFNEPEYQTFLGALNGVLRQRPDIIIFWPVTDEAFAKRLIEMLEKVGGSSAFGPISLHRIAGIQQDQFPLVLEKILQLANWRLDDAAITTTEVDTLIVSTYRVGIFLDKLQRLISERFDVEGVGTDFPTLAIVISSGEPKIREVCRSLRRADSYYIEASRLLMYTRKSNVAEWWGNRATNLKSALPHVIALFNAQLVSMSASAVVHSLLQFGEADLKDLVNGVRADRGNARRVMASSEIYKFLQGEAVDNREYGSNVKEETFQSYSRIQTQSEIRHRAINEAILSLVLDSGAQLPELKYEINLTGGLQTDAVFDKLGSRIALEFHHKATTESTTNKIAIYVLEKLKEYAINFGLADR